MRAGALSRGRLCTTSTVDAGGIAWASRRVPWIGLDGADKSTRPLFSIRRTGSMADQKSWGVLLLAAAAIVRHHPPTTTHDSGGRLNEPSLTKRTAPPLLRKKNSPPPVRISVELCARWPAWVHRSLEAESMESAVAISRAFFCLPCPTVHNKASTTHPLSLSLCLSLSLSLSLTHTHTPNGSLAHSLTDENVCDTHPRHRDAARGVGRYRGGIRWVTRLNHGEAGDLQVLPRPWCVQSPSRPLFVCQPHLAPSL